MFWARTRKQITAMEIPLTVMPLVKVLFEDATAQLRNGQSLKLGPLPLRPTL